MKTQKLLVALLLLLIISWPTFSLAQSGCCSWHGGVCGCDSSVGRQECCDGTLSPSCTCAYNPPKPVSTKTATIPSFTKDTTDYQALSASLKSELVSCKSNLDSEKKSSSDKSKMIIDRNSTIENLESKNGWLWFWVIVIAITTIVLWSKLKKLKN